MLLGARSGHEWSESDRALAAAFADEDGCCLGEWFTEHLQKLGADYLLSGFERNGA